MANFSTLMGVLAKLLCKSGDVWVGMAAGTAVVDSGAIRGRSDRGAKPLRTCLAHMRACTNVTDVPEFARRERAITLIVR